MGQISRIIGPGRLFTQPKSKAYDLLTWVARDAIVLDPDSDKPIFEQKEVIFPDSWSPAAINAISQRCFADIPDVGEREHSLQQLIDRVVDTIVRAGRREGYFEDDANAEDFCEELKYILATGRATFDFSVWEWVGVTDSTPRLDPGRSIVLSIDHLDILRADSPERTVEHAVRLSDRFMQAVLDDSIWKIRSPETVEIVKSLPARELFHDLAKTAWESGKPTLQYKTAITTWQTISKAGHADIEGLGDELSSLASINLLRYLRSDNTFDVEAFTHTIRVIFVAQEILVDQGLYVTEQTNRFMRAYRPIGLSFSNLNAVLAAQGIAYDSAEARAEAAAIAACMTAQAYTTSAKISRLVGPFAGYHKNSEAILRVIRMHRREILKIDAAVIPEELLNAAVAAWDEAVELSELYGVRNSQTTVWVSSDMDRLLDPEPWDDTGDYLGQIKMISAIQPFVSGIIDRAIHLSTQATVEDAEQLCIDAWKKGLKAIAIDRQRPPKTAPEAQTETLDQEVLPDRQVTKKTPKKSVAQRPLPSRRQSKTYEFRIGDVAGVFTIGEYDDGTPGELSIRLSKQHQPLSGLVDALAATFSLCLQHGVPLKIIIRGLVDTGSLINSSEPIDVRAASTITDYIVCQVALDYLSLDDRRELGLESLTISDEQISLLDGYRPADIQMLKTGESDKSIGSQVSPDILSTGLKPARDSAPLCFSCGSQTRRAGSVYVCTSCGSTMGFS